MKFREHRGDYTQSIETLVELPDTFDALLDHIRKLAEPWPTFPPVNRETMRIVPYVPGSLLVMLEGYGVLGYLDKGPIS